MALYNPKERAKHTATLLNNKLYILGGSSIANDTGKDFFYIDFSNPFNTQNLLLKDLSNINIVPPHFNAGSARGGVYNDTLFIYGGVNITAFAKMESVYTFNPQSNSWSIPIVPDDNFVIYDAPMGIIDLIGKIYIWDGMGDIILVFHTKSSYWERKSSIGAPNFGLESAATLLPDNKIIYIGKQTFFNSSIIYYFHICHF
jgi:hypothetical protein